MFRLTDMKKIVNLSRVLLMITLFGVILMTPIVANAGQVVIGSADLPYTANTPWDTITFNASKISTAGDGIYVNADNVTIDLQNDTLEFGTGYGNDVRGIYSLWSFNNLTLLGTPGPNNGGLILHGGGVGGSDTSWNATNVYLDGSTGLDVINIIDVDMELYGFNGHNVYMVDRSGLLNISGGRIVDHLDGFTSRCTNTGVSIFAPWGDVDIHDVTIDSWAHGIAGGGLLNIYNCSLLLDVKNDLYSYPSSNLCWTSTGIGGIGMWQPDAGTKIHDNVILAGNVNEGVSLGIALSYGAGTAENPIEIYNNYVNIHRGRDDYLNGVTCHPYKQRWSNKHVNIRDNTFIASSHTNHPEFPQAYGPNVEGIALAFTSSNYGSEGSFLDSFIVFERNHIEVTALNESAHSTALKLSVRGENEGYNFTTAGNVFRNNFWGASDLLVEFGNGDGGQASTILMENDTLASVGSTYSNFYTYQSGDWFGPSTDNIVRDIVYLGAAAENSIDWDPSSAAAGSNITFQKTLEIEVNGSNSLAVTGATITVVNGYGETVLFGLTNSSGRFAGPVSYWFAAKTDPDSVNYNNFSLTVQKGADTYVSDIFVDKDIIIPPVTLLNTTGEVDSIPPDPIGDLECSTGSGEGNINLGWTSTGDDGTSGSGVLYEVRYGTTLFNASNYEGLTAVASNPPTPQPSGTFQTMTLSGLTPGVVYYTGMILFDDGGNPSPLSNVVACESSVDITTGGGGGGGGGADQYVSNLLVPAAGAIVLTNQPTLLAQNITALGTNDYFFEVATDSAFSNMETTSPAISESNSNFTEWQVNTVLNANQTYFWRVKVNDNPYSEISYFSYETASLTPSVDIIAYPNPVSFKNGEQVTFSPLPGNSVELTIQTISGETVLHKIGALDAWQWNGSNASGYTVAAGTYLWYIQVAEKTYAGKIVTK